MMSSICGAMQVAHRSSHGTLPASCVASAGTADTAGASVAVSFASSELTTSIVACSGGGTGGTTGTWSSKDSSGSSSESLSPSLPTNATSSQRTPKVSQV